MERNCNVHVIISNKFEMFTSEFYLCKKHSLVYTDENDLKAFLFGLYNPAAPGRYNAVVKHGLDEFKDLFTEGMELDKFCTRFYPYMLKLNREVDGSLDFEYMVWADIFANYVSVPDDIMLLKFIDEYCQENDLFISDLVGMDKELVDRLIEEDQKKPIAYL